MTYVDSEMAVVAHSELMLEDNDNTAIVHGGHTFGRQASATVHAGVELRV